MRKAIGALAALAALSLSTAAFAQGYSGGYRGGYQGGYQRGYAPPMQTPEPVDNIGNQGQLVIGAERLTALSFDSTTTDDPSGKTTEKSTGIALLGNSLILGGLTLSSVPRIGFDYFVIDGLSLGTSLTYMQQSAQTKKGGQSQDEGSVDTFLFAPRIGYAVQFGDTFSFWPRAGITYASISNHDGGSSADSTHFFDVTIEPLVGLSPVSHFVIIGGPYLDLGVGGSTTSSGASSIGERATSFGLTFGLAGYI